MAISGKSWNITAHMMTDDGNWLALRKRNWVPSWGVSDFDTDTIVLFDLQNPDKSGIVAYRTGIRNMTFAGNTVVLLSDSLRTEVLDLKKQKSIYFENVGKVVSLKNEKQFLLHYTKEKENRLELLDYNGNLLNDLDQVNWFYTSESGNIYAIAGTEGKGYKVILLNDEKKDTLYEYSQKIEYLDIDPNERGLMVFEKNSEGSSQEILYLDLENKAIYPLKEVFPVAFRTGFTDVIREGNIYFLHVMFGIEKTHDKVVDIWYGNDNKLKNKLYPPAPEAYYAWEPKAGYIRRIGNNELPESVYIGSERYFLSFDPDELNDYTRNMSPVRFEMYCYDRIKDNYSLIDTVGASLYYSPDGQYLLWPSYSGKNHSHMSGTCWTLFHIPTGERQVIDESRLSNPYFTTDGKGIVFDGEEALWYCDLKVARPERLACFPGSRVSIQNGIKNPVGGKGRICCRTIDLRSPLIVKTHDATKNTTSCLLYLDGKTETIIPSTSNRIQDVRFNDSFNRFSYIEENYNLPPQLIYSQLNKKGKVLMRSDPGNIAIRSLKQEIISFSNSEGVPLSGILYYPLRYDSTKTYPMVVHIYQLQRKLSNEYPVSIYLNANNDGFDLRLLLEKGYFVYFPDIVYGPKGAGLSALDCVNHGLDAVADVSSIDRHRIGLIGHSHGAYETDFIATHSDRFAAYVAGAGNSDIVRSYFSFNYNFTSPFYWQFENGQYELNKSFKEDKELYFQNNPIYNVDQVNAPVLLWAGMKDRNIYWEQTMEFYIGLKRNNKKVVALFYPDEGHTIYAPDACRDLTSRTLDWFDYFLKDEKGIDWIDREMDKDF
jgi:dipeptidyl aminopeptidase/acylaminoacyl peptidase